VPVATVEATAIVIVEVPEPGAATGFGLKPTVTPVGWPDAASVIAELKPFKAVVVIVELLELPCAADADEGEALMLKFAAVVTVKETVAVCVIPPPVPVTVIV
jgi:hypothetical protein